METYIIGLNPGFGGFNYHDPSVCLVRNGEIIFAQEEERFTRIKSAPGVAPKNTFKACFKTLKINEKDIAAIAVGYSPLRWQERLTMETRKIVNSLEPLVTAAEARSQLSELNSEEIRRLLLKTISDFSDVLYRSELFMNDAIAAQRIRKEFNFLSQIPIYFIEHHRSHAISAFYPSLFDKATIIVLDGLGEIETISAWFGEGEEVKRICTDKLPNSLGYFYGAITEFLGFKGWEGEGKTMALAPYGKYNNKFIEPFNNIISISEEGFDVSKFVSPLLGEKLSLDLELAVSFLEQLLNIKRRTPASPISEDYKDIAWAAQYFLEKSVVSFVKKALKITKCNNLCFAGGVALNCKLNMVLRELPEVSRFYVQPVASDAGVAIGAALCVSRDFDTFKKHGLPHLFLGKSTSDDIKSLLCKWNIPYQEYSDLASKVANAIANKKIVMWFNGRSEVGPRALGGRSILGDPRSIEIKVKLNEQVKRREVWRPFGPSILEEYAANILENFSLGDTAPYMIQAYKVKDNWICKIPAVIHEADSTTRPHTVSKKYHPIYHQIISNFNTITGIPLIINTSLNGPGEPLIETYSEALRFFISSAADILVIDGFWIEKPIKEVL